MKVSSRNLDIDKGGRGFWVEALPECDRSELECGTWSWKQEGICCYKIIKIGNKINRRRKVNEHLEAQQESKNG